MGPNISITLWRHLRSRTGQDYVHPVMSSWSFGIKKISKSHGTSSFLMILLNWTLCITLILVTHISIYQDPPAQTDTMTISTVKYRRTIFEHPNLTKIIGVPTYDTLHLLHNKIKSNTISFYSNLGGGQNGYLGLVVRPTAYSGL